MRALGTVLAILLVAAFVWLPWLFLMLLVEGTIAQWHPYLP